MTRGVRDGVPFVSDRHVGHFYGSRSVLGRYAGEDGIGDERLQNKSRNDVIIPEFNLRRRYLLIHKIKLRFRPLFRSDRDPVDGLEVRLLEDEHRAMEEATRNRVSDDRHLGEIWERSELFQF